MSSQDQLFRRIRALIIDADGVLWYGKKGLPGVAAFLVFLKERNIRYVIATNNSARPASEVTARLAGLGAEVSEEQVFTSARATALYLPQIAPPGSGVLVVGGEALASELTRAGYHLVDHSADVVVAGLDFSLTYDKLRRATIEIRRGAKFVGTNKDKTFPSDEGEVPGAGAILAALEAASGVAPITVGKPERAMFDLAVEKMGVAREDTFMLGDRLDTDIEGAHRAGLGAVLVLTGVTPRGLLGESTIYPDLVFDDLVTLRQAWESASQG